MYGANPSFFCESVIFANTSWLRKEKTINDYPRNCAAPQSLNYVIDFLHFNIRAAKNRRLGPNMN